MGITIIVPVYNVELYIIQCLDSIANQSITEGLECVIVNDCGNDRSMEYVNDYIKKYQGNIKFKVVHHKKNKGLSCARNTGINIATGKYLYFLDSDDLLEKNAMESLTLLLNKYKDVEMIQGAFHSDNLNIDEPYEYDTPEYISNRKWIRNHYLGSLQGNIVMAQNRLIKRDFLIKNNLFFKEGIIHEDNHWTFFLAKHLTRMAFCKKRIYYYRNTPGSITNKIVKEKEIFAYHTLLKEFCTVIDKPLSGLQKKYILETLLIVLNNKYYNGEKEKDELINLFLSRNSYIESIIFKYYLKQKTKWIKIKTLHLLIRLYRTKAKIIKCEV